ncbi:type I-MYXAN CRISPR-associated Cas8a1/Cmx1 [Leptolyngbya sp. AN02str]|uniref:type I-MYXAN CRISPR-associated Cas8a1/Cmx1 n=1 Tax=Leptolyngbya sp. AN02str TaxID=3423363 RepID=UPI003D31D941
MKSHSSSSSKDSGQPKIQLTLSDRSMTWLHKAGLVGLWMSLNQLRTEFPNADQRPGQVDWQLSSTGINLHWKGRDLDILDWLLTQSFQIDQQGMICLRGLKASSLNTYAKLAIHQGITHTFLQHNKFIKSSRKKRLSVRVERSRISILYKQLTSYIHQSFADRLCDQEGQFSKAPIKISGWLYPGAVARHALFHEQTKFEVSPEEALVLLFAPVACWYFMVPADEYYKRIDYALVIPEVDDLASCAEFNLTLRGLSYAEFWVANLREAGLKFLTLQETSAPITLNAQKQCQVILFGKSKWSSQQMVIVDTSVVRATGKIIHDYQLVCRHSLDNHIERHEGESHISVSRVRGLVADNLTQNLPWWAGFAEAIDGKELNSTKEGMLKMVEEGEWNDPGKRLFIKACHEALRRSYAKLYDRTPEGDHAQLERFNVRIRSDLGRCKNATAFRELLSKFFSKAGQIPTLQKHWEELLPITTGEVDWKLTRDLVLLALASYSKDETSRNERKVNSKAGDLQADEPSAD